MTFPHVTNQYAGFAIDPTSLLGFNQFTLSGAGLGLALHRPVDRAAGDRQRLHRSLPRARLVRHDRRRSTDLHARHVGRRPGRHGQLDATSNRSRHGGRSATIDVNVPGRQRTSVGYQIDPTIAFDDLAAVHAQRRRSRQRGASITALGHRSWATASPSATRSRPARSTVSAEPSPRRSRTSTGWTLDRTARTTGVGEHAQPRGRSTRRSPARDADRRDLPRSGPRPRRLRRSTRRRSRTFDQFTLSDSGLWGSIDQNYAPAGRRNGFTVEYHITGTPTSATSTATSGHARTVEASGRPAAARQAHGCATTVNASAPTPRTST